MAAAPRILRLLAALPLCPIAAVCPRDQPCHCKSPPQLRGTAVTSLDVEAPDSTRPLTFGGGGPAILLLAALLLAGAYPGFALAQAASGDRGYVDGGNLMSHGVEPTTNASMLSGIERGASE